MKYKFHETPPEIKLHSNIGQEVNDKYMFKEEINFITNCLGVSRDKVEIDTNHPVGEYVIFVDGKYCGYVDFMFYNFMDNGEDPYGYFEEWNR